MKTAEEKAVYWLEKNIRFFTEEQIKSLEILLKEQDRDTRHACAENVIKCKEICETANGNCAISPDDAHNAVMNTRSV